MVHTTAGYMIWAAFTFKNVFQTKEEEVFWCTADIGWITGRVDDVIIVSGHNLDTTPIEDALDSHDNVAESAILN